MMLLHQFLPATCPTSSMFFTSQQDSALAQTISFSPITLLMLNDF